MEGYRLIRLNTADGPFEWPLATRRPVLVGRPDGSVLPDIDLSPDRAVSRRHALVWHEAGRWWIRDLNSTHGTQVGSQLIEPGGTAPCPARTEILVGNTLLAIFDPETHRIRDGELALDLRLAGRLSPSLMLAGVAPVSDIVARNLGAAPSKPRTLELKLPSLGSVQIAIPRLSPLACKPLPAPRDPFDADIRRRGKRTESARWSAQIDGKDIAGPPRPCLLLGREQWSSLPAHRASLAAFVQPDHPAVVALTRDAMRSRSANDAPDAIAESIYVYLAERWQLAYRKDPPPQHADTQTVRGPGRILWNPKERHGEGTCLDLALLFVACLEAIRLHPLIAIVDLGRSTHALVGCWYQARRRVELLPDDRDLLLRDALWFDPNGCTTEPAQRADFLVATQRARAYLTERPIRFALDVRTARAGGVTPLPHE